MGNFLMTNAALIVLSALILLAFGVAIASRCFSYLIRLTRYFFLVINPLNHERSA